MLLLYQTAQTVFQPVYTLLLYCHSASVAFLEKKITNHSYFFSQRQHQIQHRSSEIPSGITMGSWALLTSSASLSLSPLPSSFSDLLSFHCRLMYTVLFLWPFQTFTSSLSKSNMYYELECNCMLILHLNSRIQLNACCTLKVELKLNSLFLIPIQISRVHPPAEAAMLRFPQIISSPPPPQPC